jgi:arylsulfatase A-like enzyme
MCSLSVFFDQNSTSYHPDDKLNSLPVHAQAVSDFNVNNPHRPTFRDVPSAEIATITNPIPGPEPSWSQLLAYYTSPYSGPHKPSRSLHLGDARRNPQHSRRQPVLYAPFVAVDAVKRKIM